MSMQPNIALVPIDDDLDVTSVARVRSAIDGLISGGCRRIVLNMAGACYVDSAGMALVLSEIRHMRSVGGLLSIINASDRVLRTLRLARLVDFMPVCGRGQRLEVPELDPGVVPEWRRVVRIDPKGMSFTRERLEQLFRCMDLTEDEVFDLTLAVGEAMGNAIDHTDGDCALVTVSSYPDRAVVDVTDCGCGYELASGLDAPEVAADAERGRGIKLMKLLADSVTITRRSSGRGTCVRIVKLVGARR